MATQHIVMPSYDRAHDLPHPQTGREIIRATIQVVEQETERFGKGMEQRLTPGEIAGIVFRLRHLERTE